jgi:ppGpp synthetase/RelA/SpoT-type nucleotidyltranferase
VQHRWTGGQLKRLSKCLRDGLEPVGDVPDYGDVMLFYNDVAVQVEQRIDEINWTELLGGVRPEVTSRAKSIDTLREKLQREPSTPLPSVQDVAGVRFEADMTLDEQDAVVERLMEAFGDSSVVRDLRKEPHSGYRAVHVWLKLPVRVELQVRTQLQGAWANMYESAADVFGREIRYGHMPKDGASTKLVEQMHALSLDRIVTLEKSRNEVQRLERHHSESSQFLQTLMPGPKGERIAGEVAQLRSTLHRVRELLREQEKEATEEMDLLKRRFDTIREERKG